MRREQDPLLHEQILSRVREGASLAEACKAYSVSYKAMLTVFSSTPELAADYQGARDDRFGPVYKRARELAQHADAEGEMEGSHKAMALLFKLNTDELERLNKKEVALIKAVALAPAENTGGAALTTPDAVTAMIAAVIEAKKAEAIEATPNEEGIFVVEGGNDQ